MTTAETIAHTRALAVAAAAALNRIDPVSADLDDPTYAAKIRDGQSTWDDYIKATDNPGGLCAV